MGREPHIWLQSLLIPSGDQPGSGSLADPRDSPRWHRCTLVVPSGMPLPVHSSGSRGHCCSGSQLCRVPLGPESQEWAPAQPLPSLEWSLPSHASRGAQGCDSSHSTGLKITTLVPQLTAPHLHLAQSTAGASSKHKQTPRDRAWAALAELCTVLFVERTPRDPLQDSIPTRCC